MASPNTTDFLDLGGQWRLEGGDANGAALACDATVPGDVHSALFDAGLIPDYRGPRFV